MIWFNQNLRIRNEFNSIETTEYVKFEGNYFQ